MLEIINFDSADPYPETDISETDAAMLKMMLKDQKVREFAHESAEKSIPLYKMSHFLLKQLIKTSSSFDDQSAKWFNDGVIQYEAASSIVRMKDAENPMHADNFHTPIYLTALLKSDDSDAFLDGIDRAHTKLLNDQPLLSDVFEWVTKRAEGADHNAVHYALFGAAAQRQIEIDSFYDTLQHNNPNEFDDLT